jgi:hypothetical protein
MMKVTLTRKNREYVVTVNGHPYTFDSGKDAWEFIFDLHKAA